MTPRTDIPRLGFRPPAGYVFDIEVFSAHEWLGRIPEEHFRYPSRLEFHQLILVTRGQFGHTVDFKQESMRMGSILTMRPGQVQRFESNKPWEGWIVIFRPESIQSHDIAVEDIPVLLVLGKTSFAPIRDAMEQMHRDASLAGQTRLIGALERAQLHTLLIRLQLAGGKLQIPSEHASSSAGHFKRFHLAIEQRLHEWHQVGAYANALGISEKTLSRATQELAGKSAKAYLSKRIALEAKRTLAYTNGPIAHVADKLGFDEATNFIKFFRRETGYAPSEFRKHHRGQ